MSNVLSASLRAGCLLTVFAVAGLWGRSYFVTDQYLRPARTKLPALIDSRVLATVPGGLLFYERSAFA
jgi:hypothetical protein